MFPHRAQTPLAHLVPGEVQAVPVDVLVLVPVLQQGLPGPPQAPALQLPLLQVPARGKQLAPSATQRFEAQQPLPWQVLPEQQICPGPPHAVPTDVVPPAPPLPAPPEPEPPLLDPPAPMAASGLVPKIPSLPTPTVPTPPVPLPLAPPPPSPPVPTTEVSPPVPLGGGLDSLQP